MTDRDRGPDDDIGAGPRGAGTRIEFYAGYRGDETPRAIIIDGVRSGIAEVLSRKRVLRMEGGPILEVWRCRLDDGRVVTVERTEDGPWRLSAS